jgi:AraC family transcriptional regulator
LKIEEKIVEEEQLALITRIGLLEEMDEVMDEVKTWIEDNEVEVAGPPFAIYYTNHQKNPDEKFKFDVGYPVVGDLESSGNVMVVSLLEHTVVYSIFKGPYSKLSEVYAAMVEFVLANNYDVIGSPKEIYHNSPEDVPAGDLLTEVQFPVIKM